MIIKLDLLVPRGCNFYCDHCGSDSGPELIKKERVSPEAGKSVGALLRLFDYLSDTFSQDYRLLVTVSGGGEPMIYWKEFLPLLEQVSPESVRIATNGSFSPQLYRELVKELPSSVEEAAIIVSADRNHLKYIEELGIKPEELYSGLKSIFDSEPEEMDYEVFGGRVVEFKGKAWGRDVRIKINYVNYAFIPLGRASRNNLFVVDAHTLRRSFLSTLSGLLNYRTVDMLFSDPEKAKIHYVVDLYTSKVLLSPVAFPGPETRAAEVEIGEYVEGEKMLAEELALRLWPEDLERLYDKYVDMSISPYSLRYRTLLKELIL